MTHRSARFAAALDALDWAEVVRQDLIPVAGAYLVLLGFLLAYVRDRRSPAPARKRRLALFGRRGRRPETASWPDLVRYLLDTVVGGYAVFLLLVTAYYLALGGQTGEFVRQALVEGSLLTFLIVLPGLVLLSWLHERPWRHP